MKFFLLSILFFSMNIFAQKDKMDTHEKNQERYIQLSILRKSGATFSKADKLKFKVVGNDTLVPLSLIAFDASKQVRVPYEYKDSLFLSKYKEVVFPNPTKSTIKIWKDTIKLYFDPSVPIDHRNELLEFAEKLSAEVDSLKITEVKDRKDSNYFIFYRKNKSDFDFEPEIEGKYGGYYTHWNGKGHMYRTVLKVNSYEFSKPKTDLQNLKYNFFRSLGYFHFSDDLPCESYLSACKIYRKLTPIDIEILKYHYSYGVCKGLNLEEFEDFHQYMKAALKEKPDAQLFVVHPK